MGGSNVVGEVFGRGRRGPLDESGVDDGAGYELYCTELAGIMLLLFGQFE